MALARGPRPCYRYAMDLEILPRGRGRAQRVVHAEIIRELDAADIALLGEERGTKAPGLKAIRERHHALARNIAGGMRPGEAGIVTGYCSSRVSILMDDPAFRELVEFYRTDVNAQYRDLHQRLSGLALDAAEILAERIEDAPEDVSTGQLMDLVKLGADRTGFGPQSSSTQINLNVNVASRLEAARKRIADRKLIDVTPERGKGHSDVSAL